MSCDEKNLRSVSNLGKLSHQRFSKDIVHFEYVVLRTTQDLKFLNLPINVLMKIVKVLSESDSVIGWKKAYCTVFKASYRQYIKIVRIINLPTTHGVLMSVRSRSNFDTSITWFHDQFQSSYRSTLQTQLSRTNESR